MDAAPGKFRLGGQHAAYIGEEEVDMDGLSDIRTCEMFCPARAIVVYLAAASPEK
jgi:ferredoxin